GVPPAGSGIVQRPAAEWRVTGAEDHGAVDEVGIVDDALAQAGDADVRYRQDQAIDHFGRRLCRGRRARRGPRFFGLAVPPEIKSLAGFAVEFAARDLVAKPGRRGREKARDFGAQHVAHRETDIEPDLIGEFYRTHRHAELFRRRVDGELVDVLVKHQHG